MRASWSVRHDGAQGQQRTSSTVQPTLHTSALLQSAAHCRATSGAIQFTVPLARQSRAGGDG